MKACITDLLLFKAISVFGGALTDTLFANRRWLSYSKLTDGIIESELEVSCSKCLIVLVVRM